MVCFETDSLRELYVNIKIVLKCMIPVKEVFALDVYTITYIGTSHCKYTELAVC